MELDLGHARTAARLRETMERIRTWEEWLANMPDREVLVQAARAATREDDLLVRDYLEDWLERRRMVIRPTTHHGYGQAIRRYLIPQIGALALVNLDRRTVEDLYAKLLGSGARGGRPLAPATVRHCHAILSRALEDAVLDGLISRNHARTVRPPSRLLTQREIRQEALQVWTADEARRFLTFVDGHRWRPIWHLALGSGLRRGELLGLRWDDVDLDRKVVVVRRALSRVGGTFHLLAPKSSRQRKIGIGLSVCEALQAWRGEQEELQASDTGWRNDWNLVFTEPGGGPIHPMELTREFRRLVREADVPVIRLHDLRHTHASLLIAANVPIRVVSDRLGHFATAMTMDMYAHVLPGVDAKAADTLDGMLAV